MPYWWQTEKIKLPRRFDRRVKLTDKERATIKKLWRGGMAIRAIARRYEDKCSRRLIQLVLFPDRAKRQAERHAINRLDGRYYPGKKKWAAIIREHRRYKNKILKKKPSTISRGHKKIA